MLNSSDVTPPPPTALKPDISNSSKPGLKNKITKMGNKDLEKSVQSEDDEVLRKTEEDQVELRKGGLDGEGKRCRVLFR